MGFGMVSMFEKDRVVSGLMKTVFILLKLKIFSRGRKTIFYGINFKKDPEDYKRDLMFVLDLYKEGKISPVVGELLPLNEVRRGHQIITEGKTTGKIVLDCTS